MYSTARTIGGVYATGANRCAAGAGAKDRANRPTSRVTTVRGRYVMLPEAMITTLKSLKLFGMAQANQGTGGPEFASHLNAQSILDSLLKAELAEREVRSVNYQMKIARFPAYRDLSGILFTQSVVNEAFGSSSASRRFYGLSPQRRTDRRARHRQDPPGHRYQCARPSCMPISGSLPPRSIWSMRLGTGELAGKQGTDCPSAGAC